MTTDYVREVETCRFGVYSAAELLKLSVCEVTTSRTNMEEGSVYDERMGSLGNNQNCPTCQREANECPGHFGHIVLNHPVVHGMFYKTVMNFLRCFCVNCFQPLLSRQQLEMDDLLSYNSENRFLRIVKRVEKQRVCNQCNLAQPSFTFNTADSSIMAVYTGGEPDKREMDVLEIQRMFDHISDEQTALLGFDPKMMHPRNLILTVLPVLPSADRPYVIAEGKTHDDDLTLSLSEIIKINNDLAKPNMSAKARDKQILRLKFRVRYLFDNKKDKATHSNNGRGYRCFRKRIESKTGLIRSGMMGRRVDCSARSVAGPDVTLDTGEVGVPHKIANELTFPIVVTRHNHEQVNSMVVRGEVKNVLRKNGDKMIMSRACFQRYGVPLVGDVIKFESAPGVKRSVRVVDPSLVDVQLRQTLVRSGIEYDLPLYQLYQHLELNDMVRTRGKSTRITTEMLTTFRVGAEDVVTRAGAEVHNIVRYRPRAMKLEEGDTVFRRLRDGDFVLLNRQPTLHTGSMLGMRVRVLPGKTLRMNLGVTNSLNADFDGDEVNIHAPTSLDSLVELQTTSSATQMLISPQCTKPNFSIVQDVLLGAFFMSHPDVKLTRAQFFQIVMKLSTTVPDMFAKLRLVRAISRQFGKPSRGFTGRGLFSLLLPDNLNFTCHNDACQDEPAVKIHRGVLYEGLLTKSALGNKHQSLIQIIAKEYGNERAMRFIDGVHHMANAYLLVRGFSVGLADCIATKTQEIQDLATRAFTEAKGIEATVSDPGIREVKINGALSRARDHGMRIAKEALHADNAFVATVTAGSKGDYFNIAQITGLLGQQNHMGERIQPKMNRGQRTLCHYPFEGLAEEDEFESRGFVRSSFIQGLKPRELWMHAITGREGVCDTATKTANSGYLQRRMVKLCEDVQVKYDRTVRTASNSVLQLLYGGLGLDPRKGIVLKGELHFIDVQRTVDRLNTRFETIH